MMAKTLTLRLSEADAELIETLKDLTYQGTASKALLEAARRYIAQAEREDAFGRELDRRAERYETRRAELREQSYALMRLSDLMRRDVEDWRDTDGMAQRLSRATAAVGELA
ncbi:MAG: hypothetical protein OXG39_07655 [Chloroflexi bacterium]|nr:hypothetical protein [Chloroflexota bacterium]